MLVDPVLAVESFAGKRVSGGDDVTVVHVLNEGLNSLSLSSLSLRHSLGNGKGGLLNSHDEGVTVWSSLCAVIEHLNDNSLLTSLSSLSENNDSSSLDATQEAIKKADLFLTYNLPISC